MKRIKFLLTAIFASSFTLLYAQEEEGSGLTISGSVDAYYKYDFSGYRNPEQPNNSNIPTSFASDQNSVSIGMVNLILEQTLGKASFVGDIAFGPRGQFQSIPDGDDGTGSFHIQNLYVAYALTDKLTLTAGYMGTFVGYEIISPTGNFNYSTSYLFTNGPFQNAGIKAEYAFSDRFSLMAGVFNDWNTYTDFNGVSDFGAQLYVAPVDGWDVYVNFITGYTSGTEIDLTTGYQITDKFFLGLNAANYDAPEEDEGFIGAALYAQFAFSDAFALGIRGENFKDKTGGRYFATADESSVTAFTLSANVKSGPLTFIPELRIDNGKDEIFFDNDLMATKSASQLTFAVVYAF
jgi:hypothetical protein